LGVAAAGGNITGQVAQALNEAADEFKRNLGDYSKAISIYFAQEAVGAQNLLSRIIWRYFKSKFRITF